MEPNESTETSVDIDIDLLTEDIKQKESYSTANEDWLDNFIGSNNERADNKSKQEPKKEEKTKEEPQQEQPKKKKVNPDQRTYKKWKDNGGRDYRNIPEEEWTRREIEEEMRITEDDEPEDPFTRTDYELIAKFIIKAGSLGFALGFMWIGGGSDHHRYTGDEQEKKELASMYSKILMRKGAKFNWDRIFYITCLLNLIPMANRAAQDRMAKNEREKNPNANNDGQHKTHKSTKNTHKKEANEPPLKKKNVISDQEVEDVDFEEVTEDKTSNSNGQMNGAAKDQGGNNGKAHKKGNASKKTFNKENLTAITPD